MFVLAEFDAIYNRLGIEGLEVRGESFYQALMGDCVADLQAKGKHHDIIVCEECYDVVYRAHFRGVLLFCLPRPYTCSSSIFSLNL